MTRLLIDGDHFVYRLGSVIKAEDPVHYLYNLINHAMLILCDVLKDTVIVYEGYLSTDTSIDFRKEMDASYKANRTVKHRPAYYNEAREFLVKHWGFELCQNVEADDKLAFEQFNANEPTVIISNDKDFKIVPGLHFNPVTQVLTYVDRKDAILNFYRQVLTGDRVDNVQGAHNIGHIKAQRILPASLLYGIAEIELEKLCFSTCVHIYSIQNSCSLPEAYTEVVKNSKLLYLTMDRLGQVWRPPLGFIELGTTYDNSKQQS